MKKYLFRFFIFLFLFICFVPVNADNTNFKEYVNDRYGFTITFPDIFTVSRESQNGDGITLLNPEKKLHLLAWGSHNVLNEKLDSYYEKEKNFFTKVEKSMMGNNFYIIEGTIPTFEGLYTSEAGKVTEDKIIVYRFSYPAKDKEKFATMVSILNGNIINGK